MARTTTKLLTTLLACAAAAALPASAAQAKPASVAYALSGTALVTFDPASPSSATSKPIAGVAAGETLVGIDVRPANGALYALGVNAVANTATLYVIGAGATPNAYASPVGTPGAIAFTTDGATVVDLPTGDYGFDVNPMVDRIRVTAGALSFRVNPTTGNPVDGNNGGGGTVTGTNPDGPVNGATTDVTGSAYTNSGGDPAAATTLYSLSATDDQLSIQNPPNTGTQTQAQPLTLAGSPLNVTAIAGFDIDTAVTVSVPNTAAAGEGYAILTAGGTTHLFTIDLVSGAVTDRGPIGDGSGTFRGLALQRDLSSGGRPAVGLLTGGTTLRRFLTGSPSLGTESTVSGLLPGEILVGIAWRPATGQLIGLGADTTADTGSLYVIDPSNPATALATAVGVPGQVHWVGADGVTPADLPPAQTGWGIDVNPTTDRVRVVAGGGLNARVNPNTGAPIDGDLGLASSPAGVNPDGPHNGAATSVTATAYTNAFAQPLTGGVTTQYALDPVGNRLLIQNPPNTGTLVSGRTLTGGCGATVDFDAVGAFDLPSDVTVPTSGGEVGGGTGSLMGAAYAALTVNGTSRLYSIWLPAGYTSLSTPLPAPLAGLAVGDAVGSEPIAIPSCPPPPPPGPPKDDPKNPIPPGPPAKDRTAPRVTKLTVKARTKKRLTIAFTTSEAGKATIKLQRRVSGRRDGKQRCVAGRKKGARCTLYKSYKTVTKTIAKAGKVSVSTTGRTGAVRILVTVRDAADNASAAKTKSATVKR